VRLYSAYGLTLRISREFSVLSGTIPASCGPEIQIELNQNSSCFPDGKTDQGRLLCQRPLEPESGEPIFTLRALEDGLGHVLSYSDGTQFVVNHTLDRISGSWQDPLTFEDFATYLIGPVMGFVLRRRGILALHASGIRLEHGAVLFCGEAGAGKSTLAAAMALAGNPVVCEDIAALRVMEEQFFVSPGYPRVCLWEDSSRALCGNGGDLPFITPNWEKRYLPLDGRAAFHNSPLPLSAIYLLAPSEDSPDAPRIERVRPQEALVEVVKNTYMNWLLDRGQREAEFDVLGQLVAMVPVHRIVPHRDFGKLNSLCRLIVDDVNHMLGHSRKVGAPAR
jgi:hypothetical protein